MRFSWLLFAAVLCLPTLAAAAEAEAPSLTQRVEHYAIDYRINDDMTHVQDIEIQQRVLATQGLEDVKHSRIAYSSSVQRVEILEAVTLKADGRQLPVPPGNFQEKANTGRRGGGPVFSDYASLELVFPEVAVGDAVRLRYRIVQTEPIFPGQFDAEMVLMRSQPYDDVRIRIDAPARLQAQFEVRELAYTNEEKDGRRILTMTWKNPEPVREQRRDWSVFDASLYPGFAYSTFPSYEAIARAYGARALPKAQVTPAVRKLAGEITRGKKARRDKAQALYEWVSRNITYGGNCVGVGAVVPRDTDFVINNRMGDCKDHATLLQALLAAEGIAATQALVNASRVYDLHRIPLVRSVNHVMNYLPEFDLFVDATAKDIPFGYLPRAVAGKPVLLVEGFREGMHAPLPSADANRQSLHAETVFLPNGTARGHVAVEQTGEFAISARAMARDMTPEQIDDMMREYFDSEGHRGFGKLTGDAADPLVDTYRYRVDFERPLALDLPGAGGLYLYPSYFSGGAISQLVDAGTQVEPGVRVACDGGISTETYQVELPAGTTIFAIPDDVLVETGPLRYEARYRRDGLRISARRQLEDRTRGPVCDEAQQLEFQAFARKVQRDLRAQIVYQLKEAPDSAVPVSPQP